MMLPIPPAVVSAFGLPGPITAWCAVGGAWSNRVYQLGAGGRRFAVKEMRNPWADSHWQEWLARCSARARLSAEEKICSAVPGRANHHDRVRPSHLAGGKPGGGPPPAGDFSAVGGLGEPAWDSWQADCDRREILGEH